MSDALSTFLRAYDLELGQMEERIRGLRIEAQCLMSDRANVIADDRQSDLAPQLRGSLKARCTP